MKHISGPLEIKLYNGAVALVGQAIDTAVLDLCQTTKSPSHQLHITLLTAAEYKEIKKPPLYGLTIQCENIYILPPAAPTKSNVCYLPVIWNHADIWRKFVGLGSKSYHITLSHTDEHSLDKSLSSYFTVTGTLNNAIGEAAQIDVDALDHLVVSIFANPAYSMQAAQKMVGSFPTSYKGYLRFVDAMVALNSTKSAALSYAQSQVYEPSLLVPVSQRIRKLSDSVSYGPIVTAKETEQIDTFLRQYLLQAWTPELDMELSQKLWTAPTTSRERNLYLGYELPRFFSWIYPSRLTGMSTPRNVEDINILIDMGFSHILTLTRESPLDSAWFHLKSVRHIYVPLSNYGAPTVEEMDTIFEQFSNGGTWLVHCGGGVGRAGTVIVCLMAMFGHSGVMSNEPQMGASTAISLLRKMRPKSLESELQEKFVSAYVSHRWKISHEKPNQSEPVTKLEIKLSKPENNNDVRNAASQVIFMIGKPGSGKSWLACAIAKRRGKTVVISQDTHGRSACEQEMSKKHPDDVLLILDRCNPQRKDRADWIKLAFHERRCVAIHFNYDSSLCLKRINGRLEHPTIRAGRGTNALEQMEREMEEPCLNEGFDAILRISSFQAAIGALQFLTKTPPLLKFPRTPHLLDTGASGKDDIALADFDKLTGHLTVEEKIDGANMTFSLDLHGVIQCQNRSHWVNASNHIQFKPLTNWLDSHGADLAKILHRDSQFVERYILYGEWVVAKHSVHYTNLPNFFLAFDIYGCLENSFVSWSVLTSALRGSSIAQVPLIKKAEAIKKAKILEMVQIQSAYSLERR